MRYYKVEENKNNPIIKMSSYQKQIEEGLKKDESIVLYYDSTQNKLKSSMIHFKDHILVSTEVKNIFKMYENKLEFKQIILVDLDQKQNTQYWMLVMTPLECASETSQIGRDQSILKLVLKQSAIRDKDLFISNMIKDSCSLNMRKTVIISLKVVESLLRRSIVDMTYEEVKVAEGE